MKRHKHISVRVTKSEYKTIQEAVAIKPEQSINMFMVEAAITASARKIRINEA